MPSTEETETARAVARRIGVRGVVQGVGFRPFVYRLARRLGLAGWVLNDRAGVVVHVEGRSEAVSRLVSALETDAPAAARVERVDVTAVSPEQLSTFEIRSSHDEGVPTVRIAPDIAVCARCVAEMTDSGDRRHQYPYINCTDCGPRYSIVTALPYDRAHTTMAAWPMCERCAAEYRDPLDRRYHAQPVACPECGPGYRYHEPGRDEQGVRDSAAAVAAASDALRRGKIVALKGIGGYHLACDARQPAAVRALRERKYRKEQAFALMARDSTVARSVVDLSVEAEAALNDASRPIVLAPGRELLEGVAPDNLDLGVMLPYTPLHHLLFAAGAPPLLVVTSGNRSSEPIAYQDDDARRGLGGIADGFLVGERPIARRIDDSIVRGDPSAGVLVLRRARGLAPRVVGRIAVDGPVLAVGADLKSTVTLVVAGEAVVSQHIGDLAHFENRRAHERTITDLLSMYEIDPRALIVMHDRHPQYASTAVACAIPGREHRAVQHHRAHAASVLVEQGAMEAAVVAVVLDGTGYGDDDGIWGGELFAGSVRGGLRRVGHLREAALAGGDAAARHPAQAAAGFLAQVAGAGAREMSAAPFGLPGRYGQACALIERGVRVFRTTSMGRLFDCIAALVGFTRPITFEGQAAIWLEHLARGAGSVDPYPMPYHQGQAAGADRGAMGELDFRPLLAAVLEARRMGAPANEIARAAHGAIAAGVVDAACRESERAHVDTVVLSGGVFQNMLLLWDVAAELTARGLRVWTNRVVPANDGGISLGQAALVLGPRG